MCYAAFFFTEIAVKKNYIPNIQLNSPDSLYKPYINKYSKNKSFTLMIILKINK